MINKWSTFFYLINHIFTRRSADNPRLIFNYADTIFVIEDIKDINWMYSCMECVSVFFVMILNCDRYNFGVIGKLIEMIKLKSLNKIMVRRRIYRRTKIIRIF